MLPFSIQKAFTYLNRLQTSMEIYTLPSFFGDIEGPTQTIFSTIKIIILSICRKIPTHDFQQQYFT
jgi:hypothetical protein